MKKTIEELIVINFLRLVYEVINSKKIKNVNWTITSLSGPKLTLFNYTENNN